MFFETSVTERVIPFAFQLFGLRENLSQIEHCLYIFTASIALVNTLELTNKLYVRTTIQKSCLFIAQHSFREPASTLSWSAELD